ncbi:MAG: hypothetical protein JRF43_05380, partial [Deltaproteobacteria bacterium]|nr:hypothetical protein [Deltaproteobacteria bacterium]
MKYLQELQIYNVYFDATFVKKEELMREEDSCDLHYLMEDQPTSWEENIKKSVSKRTKKAGRTYRGKYEGGQSLYRNIDQEDKGGHESDRGSTLGLFKEDEVKLVEVVVEEKASVDVKDVYLDEGEGWGVDPVKIYLKEMGNRVFSRTEEIIIAKTMEKGEQAFVEASLSIPEVVDAFIKKARVIVKNAGYVDEGVSDINHIKVKKLVNSG